MNPLKRDIKNALKEGIHFLFARQKKSGEIPLWAARDPALEKGAREDHSLFATPNVLYSIKNIFSKEAESIKENALSFLLNEMDEIGFWKYWSGYNTMPFEIPPDLDDIACNSAVLKKYHIAFPENRDYINENRNPDGLYYTYLIPRTSMKNECLTVLRKDVSARSVINLTLTGAPGETDLVVNTNVIWYLGESEATKRAVDTVKETILKHKEEGCSSYYPEALTLYYCIGRAYESSGISAFNSLVPVLKPRIKKAAGPWGEFKNELYTALALSSLSVFKDSDNAFRRKGVRFLLNEQRPDGSWPRYCWYVGPAPYYGSESLTTAFCLEALNRFMKDFL